MMRGCKLCIPLIRLFLPLSLSCTPSFTAATYGRQLCREPQSVFTARRTLSHTAAQMLDQRGAPLQPSCLWPHFFFFSCPRLVPAPLLLHAPLLLSEGELLMTWRVQTAVPAAATGKVHGSPFSVNKNKQPLRL